MCSLKWDITMLTVDQLQKPYEKFSPLRAKKRSSEEQSMTADPSGKQEPEEENFNFMTIPIALS